MDTWPTGTGRPGLETYSGTYIVLGKAQVVQMDSCSARITCDKKDPDYYNEKEYWATRITASGTFLHAASWDGLLGRANVSHGCIHLSDADAKDFYNHAVVGDVGHRQPHRSRPAAADRHPGPGPVRLEPVLGRLDGRLRPEVGALGRPCKSLPGDGVPCLPADPRTAALGTA